MEKIFSVTGRGEFPLDMLRYDECRPLSENDEANINDGVYSHLSRAVNLVADGTYIHPARWASFGWHVHGVPGDYKFPIRPEDISDLFEPEPKEAPSMSPRTRAWRGYYARNWDATIEQAFKAGWDACEEECGE